MNVDKKYVLHSLLQANYLPNQQNAQDELPRILNSKTFSEDLARRLESLPQRRPRHYAGYDAVDYRLTRFNNVPRLCSIPHPKAYASLTLEIFRHWDKIAYITQNPISRIVPQKHSDGRLLVMNYEDRSKQIQEAISASFGCQYIVNTDIANCFPSIYSHAVSWAAVGIEESKQHIGKRNKWYNRLDAAIRLTKRNETTGIAIGPGTSSIVAEMILARVDSSMKRKFTYTRYIDDYTAFCRSTEEAEEFIFSLSNELSQYKLTLNVGKTETVDVPHESNPGWIVDLHNALPEPDRISLHNVVSYLDLALHHSRQSPDSSVLKYGLRSLIATMRKGDPDGIERVVSIILKYALNLAFHYSALIPLLETLLDFAFVVDDKCDYGDHLQSQLYRSTSSRHSDAVSWILYFCIKYRVRVTESSAERIVQSEDCIPMLLLYESGNMKYRQMVIDFAKGLDRCDLYGLDRYCLLLYQLFRDDLISNPYSHRNKSDEVFETMRAEGASFIGPVVFP